MIYAQAYIEAATAQIIASTPHSMEKTMAAEIIRALADSGAFLTEAWRRARPRTDEETGIMTNEKEEIDAELQGVPVLVDEEIGEDDRYLVDYVQAYAGQDEAGDWQVHLVLVWEGETVEIVLSANDAKALSGGVAMANSYILKERTKERFGRRKAPKTAD